MADEVIQGLTLEVPQTIRGEELRRLARGVPVDAFVRLEWQKTPSVLDFPDHSMTIHLDGRFVSTQEGIPSVTRKEFDILACLARQADRVLSREQILAEAWGNFFGDMHVVDVHTSNLRRKLNIKPSPIRTVRGIGFVFDSRPRTKK